MDEEKEENLADASSDEEDYSSEEEEEHPSLPRRRGNNSSAGTSSARKATTGEGLKVETSEEKKDEESDENDDDAVMDDSNETGPPVTPSNQPPPRLMITHLEIENFKSYAGVKRVGPFHKCFSAVIGPNGSGKSNNIDALLFVFGKRAKKLRLNKVSELIHKSDAVKANPPQYARVSVFFQEIIDIPASQDTSRDSNGFTVVPGSKHVVTRIARKDNSSTYKLDGKNCQFKDVARFLDKKGIDLDNNRFLILQGEVEMISMMAPRGREGKDGDEGLLEYLEDIIGSNKYVEPTQEALVRVEKLTEVRNEKLQRCKAVEKEKDSLQSAKQEAEALLQKEREIRRHQNLMYQLHLLKTSREQAKAQEKLDSAQEKLDAEQARLTDSKQRLSDLETSMQEQQESYNKAHDELVKTKEQFTEYERRDIKLKEDLKAVKAQITKAEKKVEAERKKQEQAEAKEQNAKDSIPDLEERIEQFKSDQAEQEERREELQAEADEKTTELRAQLDAKTKELAPVQQEKTEHENQINEVRAQQQILTDASTRAKKDLDKAQGDLSTVDERQTAKQQELQSAQEQLGKDKERLAQAQQEDSQMAQEQPNLERKHQDAMRRAAAATNALEESQQTGRGGVPRTVQAILKATTGQLKNLGIIGRLGDLATVDRKYDIAASTAGGGTLDSIVVQTTAGAQKCLEWLRKNNLGRASFIPLDNMKKGAHDVRPQTPEGAPRLIDFMTPTRTGAAVMPALFSVFRHTLVAPDLETATRWAYDFGKRWRVVTVDGKLVETTGVMTGGGTQPARGKMLLPGQRPAIASNNMSKELEQETQRAQRLEQEAQEAEQQLRDSRQRRSRLESEIRDLTKRIRDAEQRSIPKLTMDVKSFDGKRASLEERIPQLEAECEMSDEDKAQLAELEKHEADYRKEMAACAKLYAQLEKEVANFKQQIMDAGGAKLKKQADACKKAAQDLQVAEKALTSAKVTIKSSQKTAAAAAKAQASTESELEKLQENLESTQQDRDNLQNDSQTVKEEYEAVKESEQKARKELDKATKEFDALKKSVAKEQVVEIELQDKVATHAAAVSDCAQRESHWQRKLQQLRKKAAQEEAEWDCFSDDEDDDDEEKQEAEEVEDGSEDDEECEDRPETDNDGDTNMDDADEQEEADADCSDNDESEGASKKDNSRRRKSDKKQSKAEALLKQGGKSLPTHSPHALTRYTVEELQDRIAILETERNTIAKNANMGAIAEYRKKEADYLLRVGELDAVTEERNDARKEHEELRRKRLEMFMDGFGKITLKLKEMYQMITLGGDAELELVDSLDPFSEGIVFSVRPPKKSWKNISNLSGGEKTLSSLALVFALHHYKPTPLYVMDEIDAALDFKNVSIVANYIKERTKNAQFIIISLRNNMFELADRLVGIYKTNDCTKSVTVDPKAFADTSALPVSQRTPNVLQEQTNQATSAVRGGALPVSAGRG